MLHFTVNWCEHGTDRSGQLLLLLAFVYFLELFFLEKNRGKKKNYLIICLFFNFFIGINQSTIYFISTY